MKPKFFGWMVAAAMIAVLMIVAGSACGGHESSEDFTANNFGDFLYAGRLESEPVPGLVFGGHYSSNRHDDAVFKDTKTVFDLERESWSADLNLHLPTATRLYAFYGQGDIDDFWAGVNYIYDYQGYGIAAFQGFADNLVEVGVRFDSFTTEFSHDENTTEQQNLTIALNLNPHPNFQFFFDLTATPGATPAAPTLPSEKDQTPLRRF